ncbi:MAG: polyprenyl synthetase family protein [Salinivirgaceae bacterium]|jgi:geranylgeranyl diphosphate synthase type II|nr:polyprenyl synthetase family protein [Salinivirgaceae bacterium]
MQGREKLREIVEAKIQLLEFKNPPAELYDPISYTLNSDGKRIRPMLTLLACQMFSEKIDDAILPALGFEVFHNFTLLHDDIMDNAPVRRGVPTVHEKWSVNTAILSGDAMMVEAFKLISKAPKQCLSEVIEVFNDTALGVCEGQMFDMQFEERSHVSEDEYLEMIRLKTSVLLAACLKAGALIGGATIENASLLYDFGINLGLAFQLKDDWLDVYSDPEVFGKKTGGDIVENKKTYLLINALERAEGRHEDELDDWINKTNFIEEDKIAAVKEIYNILGIGDLTLEKALEYSKKAFDCLNRIEVPELKKKELMELGKYLLDRAK